MSIIHALTYGFIQGLTEFLPISSSAHLILLPYFTGWEDPGLAFDVALHWGTLAAILIYFRREVADMFRLFIESLKGARSFDHVLPWKIIAATVPGALIGFLLEKKAEHAFRNPLLLAGTLSIMGIGLLISDRLGSKKKDLATLNWTEAILIGLGQGLAIIPGVSRSGITMTMGLLLGLKREEAVRFSFFLAMPITFGAGLVKCKYLIANIADPSLLTAVVSSALFGLAAIHVLLTYVKNKSFTPFVVYRLMLSAVILMRFL